MQSLAFIVPATHAFTEPCGHSYVIHWHSWDHTTSWHAWNSNSILSSEHVQWTWESNEVWLHNTISIETVIQYQMKVHHIDNLFRYE